MEENNRKGPGIFYAVVGVATLVVAIIGATFAFFSVSVTANPENATIGGQTATGTKLTLDVEAVYKHDTALVPLDTVEPWLVEDETSQMTQALAGSCKDSKENAVCQVYKITVSGETFGDRSLSLDGNVNVESEAPNLKWKLITNETTDDEAATLNANNAGEVTISTEEDVLSATKTSIDYYIVIWLEETGADQGIGETNDASKSFSGTVAFTAVDTANGSNSGLTATFDAA